MESFKDFQCFPMFYFSWCFRALDFRERLFSGAFLDVTKIFAINSLIYLFSQGMYVLSTTDLSIADMLYNGHLVIAVIF